MKKTCAHCGAAVKNLAARFCEFCGNALPRIVSSPPTGRFGDLPARFAALDAHESLPELRRLQPSTVAYQAHNVARVLFALLFLAACIAVFVFFVQRMRGPLVLFPLAFLGIGVLGLGRMLKRAATLARAPLLHVPALVVDERIHVSGGGENSSAHTTYYVSLESADGRRAEYESRGELNGQIAPGDMGLAYLKGENLLDFRRVPV